MRMRLARYGHAPVALICVALCATAALTGCLGGRLSADATNAVRLQGIWRLNRTASEDPQKIIDALREEAERKIRRTMNAAPPPAEVSGGGGRGGGGRRQRGGSSSEPEDFPPQAPPPGADPLRNSPTMHALREVLQRGDFLTVRQSPGQVSFDYGNFRRSYTPGGRSVVSSETGVADQTSGWSGKQYVVNIKPQLGPAIVEEYGLSPDGKQLIVKTHIGPFELRRADLTRVYDATTMVVPNSGPSNE